MHQGFYGLHGCAVCLAVGQQLRKIVFIGLVLVHQVTVRQQHRVKVKTLQGVQVHDWRAQPMPGHANKAHQTLLSGFDSSLKAAPRLQGCLPFLRINQVVQLQQVHLVNLQAL